mgnify:CR=1 FL=1
MFTARFIAFVFSAAVLFSACNSGSSNPDSAKQQQASVSLESFFAEFPQVNLPVTLPEMQEPQTKSLSNSTIKQIFAKSGYRPAIGNSKDVPDLADNAESAKYFAEGIFRTDAFTAVIIRKTDDGDTYYYLSTFDSKGQFIDGMCVAFDLDGEISRIASINDDYSIQIGQAEKTNGAASAQTRVFFELLEDGHINSLSNNAANAPV